MSKLFLAMFFQLMSLHSFTQGRAVDSRTAQFNVADNKLAIGGYDPVAYFVNGKAIKGTPELSVLHEGIVYRFSNASNSELFRKHPSRYEPQYGGWCAYAMGKDGSKVDVDPETFKIISGKLYLFYNSFFNNTLKNWNKDERALKNKADANWPKYYHP